MESVVKINHLKKHYGKLKAVDGINIEIKKGEIFGFLGPNGAGKSTTIRCMMGFNNPTSGTVKVFGQDMKLNNETLKAKIGYLPGNVKLYDNLTGWEHIKFFESVRGKSKNVNKLIDRLDFNPSVKFRTLSSGNKQKLGLILTLMNDPELIIMDEPTVGLDPLLQFEIHKILQEMRDNGATIFISSHNLNEVEELCDRVAIIKKGKIVGVESIKDLGGKKIYRIAVKFANKIKLETLKVKNVDKIEQAGDSFLISVVGDLKPILDAITKNKIIDLDISRASLEDIFMKFYERAK